MVNVLSIISYNFLPARMGGQKGIALFYKHLSQQLPVTCITTAGNDNSLATYETIKALPNTRLRYINPFFFFTVRSIIRKKKITHVILEHPYYGWLGILLKRFCHVQLVIHSHNIEAERFKSLGKWWWGILWHYEKWTHRNADHNFFIQDNDKAYAINRFGLDPARCNVITYGIDRIAPPSPQDQEKARQQLLSLHQVPAQAKILLFNGALNYQPNLNALDTILEKINPILLSEKGFDYRIIICGLHLPEKYDQLKSYRNSHIIFAGFVEDINLYFSGADVFINPVIEGGGIKTKVVEALGNDLTVVSTASGANGIAPDVTGGKLLLVDDHDWEAFARRVIDADASLTIPGSYFDHFSFAGIARKAADIIKQ